MSNEPCIHHWIIEAPNGEKSAARCKKCGAETMFDNGADFYAPSKISRRRVDKREQLRYTVQVQEDTAERSG